MQTKRRERLGRPSCKEKFALKNRVCSLGKLGILALTLLLGIVLGRMQDAQPATVHAQEKFSGVINCITVVPKSWGDFKGGSDYGLAFQDKDGNVRFLLHPSCGSLNSPMEPPPARIDLELERR
jgi:hypothetical protein